MVLTTSEPVQAFLGQSQPIMGQWHCWYCVILCYPIMPFMCWGYHVCHVMHEIGQSPALWYKTSLWRLHFGQREYSIPCACYIWSQPLQLDQLYSSNGACWCCRFLLMCDAQGAYCIWLASCQCDVQAVPWISWGRSPSMLALFWCMSSLCSCSWLLGAHWSTPVLQQA